MRWGGVSLASDRGGTRRQLSLRVNFKLKNTCASPRRMCDCLVPRSQAIFSLNLISSPKGEALRCGWTRVGLPGFAPQPPQRGPGPRLSGVRAAFPRRPVHVDAFVAGCQVLVQDRNSPAAALGLQDLGAPCPWAGSLPLAQLVLSGLHLIPHPVRDQGTFSWLKYWLCAGRWPSVHTL